LTAIKTWFSSRPNDATKAVNEEVESSEQNWLDCLLAKSTTQ